MKKKGKGMVLYSAVSSPLDRSKRFTLGGLCNMFVFNLGFFCTFLQLRLLSGMELVNAVKCQNIHELIYLFSAIAIV